MPQQRRIEARLASQGCSLRREKRKCGNRRRRWTSGRQRRFPQSGPRAAAQIDAAPASPQSSFEIAAP
jgi:hypothetical protein